MRVNKSKIQERAEKLVRQGKIASAIAEYRTLLADQPDDLNTINRVGDLLVRTGELEEAIELFGRAAHLHTVGGFFLKAIAIYKKILKVDPSVVDPRLRLADLYARRDLITEARAEYIVVAEKYVRDGSEMRAREVYERLIRMEPGNVMARTALADIYLGRGDTARAVGELRAAARELETLSLKPESLIVHRRIIELASSEIEAVADSVRALARLGDLDGALAAGEALRQAHPEEAAPVEAVVEALEVGGRPEQAEELVKSALGDSAQEAVPRMVLGRLHLRSGRKERAEPLLLEAAQELVKAARFAEAASALDLILEAEPEHRVALERRLEIARRLGTGGEVETLSERVVGSFGDSQRDPIVHEVTTLAEKPLSDARAAVPQRALTREERDFLSEHMTEAEVFVKYGLLDKAIEPLLLVLSRFPDHLDAHQHLKTIYGEQGQRAKVVDRCLSIAEIHERAGRRDEAIRTLSEARNLDPENPVVRGRLERLGASPKGLRRGEHAAEASEAAEEGDLVISVDDESEAATGRIEGFLSSGEADPGADAGHAAGATDELEGAGGDGSPAEPGLGAGDEGGGDAPAEFFDLAGEYGQSLAEVLEAEGGSTPPAEENPEFGEMFRAFQQKVEQEVGSEDYKMHYDLAIAYKEMGLIDEAVAEFQHAARDDERFLECCSMLGVCFREKGMPALAEKWYLKALQNEGIPTLEELGLRFDLAETYLEMGDYARAKEAFERVARIDNTYRGVVGRLAEVKDMV